ncbi:MAG: L-alanine-DL-glutamate epimerase-like enolase superfamily enzyme [Spirosomataceae bacterium]|jgi:L-alanine-DL-glutamate epimerase-like enolase superfamily enzyme
MPLKLSFHIIHLKNKHTFRIAHGTRTGVDTFIVSLSDGQFTGLGEATPVPYYGFSANDLKTLLEQHQEAIETYDLQDAEAFWKYMDPTLSTNRFAQCALDIAAHDLVAKRKGLPLYKTWGLEFENTPLSNFTIGIDEIPVMIDRMREVDFPIYKIKLGTPNDIEIIKELRKSTDAVFRVDANCAWTVEETITNSAAFESLGVEFIEQPLPNDKIEEMIEVKKRVNLPLMADESCIVETDVEKCFGKFDGVNIKLAKCGGLTPALRMIQKAKSLGLKTMVGCMTESSVGISAIAHLLPLLDYVDMDGSLLISNDPADGVVLNRGKAILPNQNGTGAELRILL